ncbi:MAG TPA: SLC13 family permease [Afifellaceae bacterium]|nr:SLC13 family permease [Afifellaceae bacterium]
MTTEQITLFCLFGLVFAMLLWGRFRYDLVAFGALLIGLILGVVPEKEAFSGFGHPATIIVALVLVVSRGLMNSGAVDLIARSLIDTGRTIGAHISIMAGVGAVLSAFMNNVAALALLMPVELQASNRASRSPGITLMPLAFATILGGLVTLIGTPPNIIIAQFRADALGEPYHMFDFAPVGLACATAGIMFVALIGWRLLPKSATEHDSAKELIDLAGYIAELVVPEDTPAVDKMVRELEEEAEEADATIIGLVRNGRRLPGFARNNIIRAGDILVVEASPDAIDRLKGALKLEVIGEKKHSAAGADMTLMEVIVQRDSRINGRSADDVRLLRRQGVTLLGVSRNGRRFTSRVRRLTTRPGDILLLFGPSDRLLDVSNWLGTLTLAERGLQVTQHSRAWLAVGIFAAAITAASLGFVYLPVALGCVAGVFVVLDIVPLREVYDHIEWPVVVLLGSMLPLGAALEASGGTTLIAESIVSITAGLAPAVVLTVLMIVTMTLSDVLNNTATTVIAAPIAVQIASSLGVNPDPFLMAVAVAASCAFLTPIGHKNNTLIMGPGGYKFGDYWRMGLPLEILIVAVAIPTILIVWPL